MSAIDILNESGTTEVSAFVSRKTAGDESLFVIIGKAPKNTPTKNHMFEVLL